MVYSFRVGDRGRVCVGGALTFYSIVVFVDTNNKQNPSSSLSLFSSPYNFLFYRFINSGVCWTFVRAVICAVTWWASPKEITVRGTGLTLCGTFSREVLQGQNCLQIKKIRSIGWVLLPVFYLSTHGCIPNEQWDSSRSPFQRLSSA